MVSPLYTVVSRCTLNFTVRTQPHYKDGFPPDTVASRCPLHFTVRTYPHYKDGIHSLYSCVKMYTTLYCKIYSSL